MHLRHGLLVLHLSCTQQPQHVLGPLCHGVLYTVVMPQLLHTQLHPAEVRLAWETMTALVISMRTNSHSIHTQMIDADKYRFRIMFITARIHVKSNFTGRRIDCLC